MCEHTDVAITKFRYNRTWGHYIVVQCVGCGEEWDGNIFKCIPPVWTLKTIESYIYHLSQQLLNVPVGH